MSDNDQPVKRIQEKDGNEQEEIVDMVADEILSDLNQQPIESEAIMSEQQDEVGKAEIIEDEIAAEEE